MRTHLLILAVAAALGAGAANAQPQSSADYYSSRSSPALAQLLDNVERAHIGGCAEGVKTTRYSAALSDCEFILRYFPNHPRVLLMVSELCLTWKNARCNPDPYFEQAIAVNPNVATTFTTRGIYLLRASRVADAIAALERAVALDSNSVNAQYNLGLAYVEAKQYDLANRHAQRAYQLGAPVPGLRERLKRAGHWKPDVEPPADPSGSQTVQSGGK